MKKTLSIVLALCLALSCLFSCLTASAEAVAEAGVWELTDITRSDIEQGKLINAVNNTIPLLPDGTHAMSLVYDTHYSSDGGETYNPVSYITFFVYGTYEVTEIDEDLGDVIISITSLDRIVCGDYDSAVNGTEEDAAALAAHPFVGTEIILGGDHKPAEAIDMMIFMEVSHYTSPY